MKKLPDYIPPPIPIKTVDLSNFKSKMMDYILEGDESVLVVLKMIPTNDKSVIDSEPNDEKLKIWATMIESVQNYSIGLSSECADNIKSYLKIRPRPEISFKDFVKKERSPFYYHTTLQDFEKNGGNLADRDMFNNLYTEYNIKHLNKETNEERYQKIVDEICSLETIDAKNEYLYTLVSKCRLSLEDYKGLLFYI